MAQTGFPFDFNSDETRVRTAFVDPSASGNNAFVAAVADRRIRVVAYRLQAGGTVSIKFTDTDGATLSQTWEFQAREGCAIESPTSGFEFETAVGKGVQVNLSAAIQAHVSIQYTEVV